MEKYYIDFKSKIGLIYLLADKDSLIAIDFNRNDNYQNAKKDQNHQILKLAKIQLTEYFEGKRKIFSVPISTSGTEFQKRAWRELQKIPFGKVLSYGQQAIKMNCPKAQRATGSANGKNPIPIIIPCHRIITADRKIGGFSNDIEIKRFLLRLEGHQFQGDHIV